MLRYQLQFFAKEGPGGEKTEEATTKKLQDAREEGQVAKSAEVITAVALLAMFLVLKVGIGYIGNSFIGVFQESYSMMSTLLSDEFTMNVMQSLMNFGIKSILLIGMPLYISAFASAFLANIVQVKWKVSLKPLKPKLNRFSPISGVKRMFSKDKIVELLKSILKIGILSYVIYSALKDKWGLLLNLYAMPLMSAILLIGETIIDIGLKISYFFLAVAAADLFYQRMKFKNEMKMTKQEIKDEYKNSEGDPQIKGKRRQKMREASQRRMMQSVPEADVVITNPTHLAVAVKYDKESASAPMVTAKGADYVAQKIKEKARENDVEIVENKPLARMLYYNVELGEEIPQELYQMVAEVLAYVYGVKGKL